MRRTFPLLLTVALMTGTRAGSADDAPEARVYAANDVVDSVGVVSHFDYWGTPYDSAWPAISDALIASGIKHIRDGGADLSPRYDSRLALLGRHGINHSAMFNVDTNAAQIRDTLRVFLPYVDFVEPENEYNAARDAQWPAHLAAEQELLYRTVRAEPDFDKIAVLGPALNFASYYATLGRLDEYEDDGNLHNYPCNLNPGTTKLHFGIATNHELIRASTRDRPIWTTETGYGDDLTLKPQCGLPDDVIAVYLPRMVAERWLLGEPRTYFYQLADMPTDRRFGKLGLLEDDGTPKPQFIALRGMLQLLADPGKPFVPTPQRFDVTPLPDLRELALQKRDGTYELLLWREVESADPRTSAPLEIAPLEASVTVPAGDRSAIVRTYGAGFTLQARAVVAERGIVRVPVTDRVTFLEFPGSRP
jgi:hypothetical protein